MRFLRTNTAVIVTVGPFYDKTDGVTIETALTISNERITLTADTDDGSAPTIILDNVTGATSGTSNDLNYITGNDAGMMQLELSASNTNRLGRMLLSITDAANHVPVFHEFMVLPALVYDTFFASSGGATFPAATLASTTNITAATGVVLSGVTHTGAVIPTVTTLSGHTPQTGDSFARLGAPAGASISADVAAVKSDTAAILVDTAVIGATGEGLTSLATQASVDAVDNFVDTEISTIIADIAAVKSDTAAILVDTAEIGAAGAGLTALATQASVNTIDDFLDTEIAAILAAVDTEVAAIKAKTDNLPGATMAELAQGIPPATPSLEQALMALYMTLRNRLDVTATTKSVTNDAGTVIFKKALSDDGTTYSEAEAVSGP